MTTVDLSPMVDYKGKYTTKAIELGYILYFAWEDQRDKVCFILHKVQGCCMEKKHSYEVNLLLFLLHSAFQKVIIGFLHTSITLDSRL